MQMRRKWKRRKRPLTSIVFRKMPCIPLLLCMAKAAVLASSECARSAVQRGAWACY